MKAILVLAGLSCFTLGTHQYPSGTGITAVCDTMEPDHHFSSKKNNANAPYTVTAVTTTYTHGGKVLVTIAGTEAFKGFMLQARKPDGNIAGTWDLNSQIGSQLQWCSNARDVVTHANNINKFKLEFYWEAPVGHGSGPITFFASFVKSQPDFYVMIPSAQLTEQIDPPSKSASTALHLNPIGQVTVEGDASITIICNMSIHIGHGIEEWDFSSSGFRLEKMQHDDNWLAVNIQNQLTGTFQANGRFSFRTYNLNINNGNFAMVGTLSVTLSRLGASDHGNYRCVHLKTNEVIESSSQMELFIHAKPTTLELTSETMGGNTNQAVVYNDTHSIFNWHPNIQVKLICTSTGGMPDPNVILTLGGNEINTVTEKSVQWKPATGANIFQTQTTMITLTAEHNPSSDDAGKLIECKSMSTAGAYQVYFNKIASIVMAFQPSILCIQVKPAKIGELNVKIRCHIVALPEPTEIWWEFLEGGELQRLEADGPGGFGYITTLERDTSSTNVATFEMSHFNPADFQVYKLNARNSVGTAEARVVPVLNEEPKAGEVSNAGSTCISLNYLVVLIVLMWHRLL